MTPDEVSSRESLVTFVRDLAKSDKSQWENDSLDRYLEALSAWLTDIEGWTGNRGEPTPTQPSWQLVAHMLHAATLYE
jgi:hypothetical protein